MMQGDGDVVNNDAYMRDLKIFAPADCIVSNTAADNDHALRQIRTVLKGNIADSLGLTFSRGLGIASVRRRRKEESKHEDRT